MAITVPTAGTIVDATTFGKPVADAININSMQAARVSSITGVTVASGANTPIFDVTFTLNPGIVGLFVIANVGLGTANVGDLLINGNGVGVGNAGIAGLTGISVVSIGFVPNASNSARVAVHIYAWGGGSIIVDGAKSKVAILAITQNVTGNAFT